jgi:hypothetical protein
MSDSLAARGSNEAAPGLPTREQIAKALCAYDDATLTRRGKYIDNPIGWENVGPDWRSEYLAMADAVLALFPARARRRGGDA